MQRGVLVEAIQHALNAWDFGGQPLWKASIDGLINQTYFIKVDHTPVAVLQRLNTDIFEPTLHSLSPFMIIKIYRFRYIECDDIAIQFILVMG